MACLRRKKGGAVAPPFPLSRSTNLSIETEVHFNIDLYCHRLAVFHRRLEFPIAHCLNRLLVQSHAQRARDLDVAWMSIGSDDQPQHAGSLVLRLAGLFRIFGIGRIQRARRRHTTTDAEDTAANTAAVTRADTGASTRSHTPART